MNQSGRTNDSTAQAIEIAIRLGLIFLILAWCLQILAPFIGVIVWGAIIAVAIYPLHMKLAGKLGGKNTLSVTIITLVGIVVILVPFISMSGSMIDGATSIGSQFADGKVQIPAPTEAVKEWPLVGEKAYAFWMQASTDMSAFLETHADQFTALGKQMLRFAASIGLAVLQFIISLAIAAGMLLGVEGIHANLTRLARRLNGNQGEEILVLSEKTVRSVAVGVIGIAFIQAVLAGIGMMIAGVPAAGLLALVALVLGIAQLPPLLVLIPVIIYLFAGDSTGIAIFFLIWSIMVAASDLVLKPLLLGRGVDAPMIVVLLGALGGMLMSGIVGLFIGAVILAVGYKLFQTWVRLDEPDLEALDADAASTD